MLSFTRGTKRLIIVVIYIFLFLGVGIGVYFGVRPDPSCTDGKQNQNETGIDCGGMCTRMCAVVVSNEEQLLVREVSAVRLDDGRYDALAAVENPNRFIGAEMFRYTLRLVDAGGVTVAETSGTNSLLPRESKTLLAFALTPSSAPSKAVVEITDVTWTKLSDYDREPKFGVYQAEYKPSTVPGEFGVVSGLVVNESEYDFRRVLIKVILRDSTGKPIAINQTDRRTFLAGEQHEFRLPWYTPFPGMVEKVEVRIDTNVFDADNFLRRYLSPERVGG